MAVNIKQFTSAGADILYYGARDGNGYLIGGTATAPTAGDADGNPMLKAEGVKNFPHAITEPDVINITGDDGIISQYLFEPVELPNFVVDLSTYNLTLDALVQTTTVYSVGDSDIGVIQPTIPTYQDMILILQAQGKSRASASSNASLWHTLIVPNCQMAALGRDNWQERAASMNRYRVTTNSVTQFPWGEALSEVNNGCLEAAAFYITSENRIHMHRFTGNASQVQFNLDYTPAEESSDKCHVYVDGAEETYTTDYTIDATNKTLDFATGSTPGNNTKIVIWYEYTT